MLDLDNLEYVEVRNPKWSDQRKLTIDCEVNFNHVDFETWSPFCADPNDVTTHGVAIYERIIAGDFGEIAEPNFREYLDDHYVSSYKEIQDLIVEAQQWYRDDMEKMVLITAEQRAEAKAYKAELAAIKNHDNFPENYPDDFTLPTKPSFITE